MKKPWTILYLTKVSRISQHVDVQKFGNIATPEIVIFFPERVPDDGTLLGDDRSLICCSAGRTDRADDIP